MPGLLEGVKVIAFDQVVAFPATTAIMADWGADVIKVEPLWGDWQRALVSFNRTPLVFKNDKGEIEYHFELLNRSKKSMSLNLKNQKGREVHDQAPEGRRYLYYQLFCRCSGKI